MLMKLALRNVRRSMRDYAVYFVTLTLGVAVFYAFNAIEDSRVLFEAQEGAANVFLASGASIFDILAQVMTYFSIVVAVVLGFLVLYANRFVVRARKKEFGTYLLLGMSPRQVSSVVLTETLIVGVIALVVGLGLGFLISQAIAFATAGLIGVAISDYHLLFSVRSAQLTLGCFALIFAVVALFNAVQISRCKLVTLLSAGSRNERTPMRNPIVCLVVFVLSCLVLAKAYAELNLDGLVYFGEHFRIATALMLVGTLGLFWSASGFFILLIQRLRSVYFKGLAMFTMRQIAAKVNTAFVSLWVVSVLLLFSIVVFSTGFSLASLFSDQLEENTQFDASIRASLMSLDVSEMEAVPAEQYGGEDEKAAAIMEAEAQHDEIHSLWQANGGSTAAYFKSLIPDWGERVTGSAQVDTWLATDLTNKQLVDACGFTLAQIGSDENSSMADEGVQYVPLSQFNAARQLAGEKPIELASNEYLVDNTVDKSADYAKALGQKGRTITVDGHKLTASGQVVSQSLQVSNMSCLIAVLVVPDELAADRFAAGDLPYLSELNVNLASDSKEQAMKDLMAEYGKAVPPSEELAEAGWTYDSRPWPVSYYDTSEGIIADSMGLKLLLVYLALYVGFIFLMTTAAVLSVQQLSEVADGIPRYRLLAQLGCDRSMVLRSLRTQIGIYFVAPLLVAGCHSACAISLLYKNLLSFWGTGAVSGTLAVGIALVVAVYAIYLASTYLVARSAVISGAGKKLLA
ncbi:ABC transporter permease [uncultured Senegalimassilia sp.]|uniref:ABC transporter permease n=1 Tax=uncultured Senegalimassilia sp. TaxID=1714350 RepID=UPI0027DD3CBB|nr:ABC transporter permease [uncultured Senegalimassilia sp.]